MGGTGGSAYKEAVLGYGTYGLPTGTETVIPSSAGALAGTYKQGYAYTAYGDLLASYYDYAAGGLPAEQVDTGYDAANDPVSLGSSLWSYVAALSYTELGQPQEYAFGTTNEPAWLLDSYDQETGRLTSSEVQTGVSPVTVGRHLVQLRQRREHHRRGRHPGQRPGPGAVLPLRLPRPAHPGLVPGLAPAAPAHRLSPSRAAPPRTGRTTPTTPRTT